MAVLWFPEDRVVGVLDWLGAWSVSRGPVLAIGQVEVPDDQKISLRVTEVTGSERHGDTWQLRSDGGPVDISFLTALEPTALTSLSLGRVTPGSYPAIAHLAKGLRSVHLSWSELTDDVLLYLAQLTWLESLQTYGNFFTDEAVQVLSSLTGLVSLCLEEETLTAAAFTFAHKLPHLKSISLQDGADIPRRDPPVARRHARRGHQLSRSPLEDPHLAQRWLALRVIRRTGRCGRLLSCCRR